MRRLIVPALVAAVVASSSAAFAAQTVNGTVKTINSKQMTLTLTNGALYHLPSGWKDPAVKKGAKVAVTFDRQKGVNNASQVKLQ